MQRETERDEDRATWIVRERETDMQTDIGDRPCGERDEEGIWCRGQLSVSTAND